MKHSLLLLLVLMGLSSACQTSKPLDSYKGEKVIFGSGGGFTGLVTTYTLLADGRLFKQNSMGDTALTEVLRMPKATAKALMKEKASLPTSHFQQPGNMYSFLEWTQENETHRVTWGAPQGTPPAEVVALYRSLMEKINPEE